MLSLKAQRAKAKEDKKVKKIERAAKQKHKAPRQNTVKVMFDFVSAANRRAFVYQEGEDYTDDEIAAAYKNDLQHWQNLIHYQNIAEAISHFETVIRGSRLLGMMLQDEKSRCHVDLINTANKAQAELQFAQVYGMPIQERSKCFEELETLCYLVRTWQGALSKKSFRAIEAVNTAMQVNAYFAKLFEHDKEMVKAAFRIIHGESSRKIAAELGIKETELKMGVLPVGKYLYRIGITQKECEKITPAGSIPEMRANEYKYLADFNFLATLAALCMNDVLQPFRNNFQVDFLNLAEYQETILRVLAQLRSGAKT